MLNFIAIDLQLYKIFKITRVAFFWDTLYMSTRYTSVGLALLQCPPVYSDVKRPVSFRSVKIVSRIESCGKFKSVTDTKRCHIM